MSSISDFLLTGLITYGAPLFGLALLLGAIGVPIPTSLMVIAAGAFSRQGMLNLLPAAGLGLLGAVAGDSLSFIMGRWGGNWVSLRFGGSSAWISAQSTFNRNSRLAVFLTRFLLTAIALPVNLMAGSSCQFRRFLITVIAGEAVWIIVYGGLGYLFGSQWELISQFLSDFGGLALGLAMLGGGIYYFLRKRSDTLVVSSTPPTP
ncbi:MAG: VTT domain-containing protein [Chloroflexota bacterium]